jgi:hypothetical protein
VWIQLPLFLFVSSACSTRKRACSSIRDCSVCVATSRVSFAWKMCRAMSCRLGKFSAGGFRSLRAWPFSFGNQNIG